MTNTAKNRKVQLGMPFGTACGRLRKILLHQMAIELNRHFCFVCNEPINTVEEFTVEHKKPWYNVDPELFWDLTNIAFSHSVCNRPHKYSKGRTTQREGPSNTWFCETCKTYKTRNKFSERSPVSYSPRLHCRGCRAEQRKLGKFI